MAHCLMEAAGTARKYWMGPFHPDFRVQEHLRSAMDKVKLFYNVTSLRSCPSLKVKSLVLILQLLPDDIHERASGRLFISVTKVMDGTNIVLGNQVRSLPKITELSIDGLPYVLLKQTGSTLRVYPA